MQSFEASEVYVKLQRFDEVAVEYPLRPAAIRGRGRQDAGASKVSSVLVGTATFLFYTALELADDLVVTPV